MKVLLLVLITVLPAPAISQTVVSGRVTDMSGHAVAFANIMLMGTYDGTSSDAEGNFRFQTSALGSRELQVSSVGFNSLVTRIELTSQEIFVSVQLEERLHSLDVVTITAGSFTAGDEAARTIFRAVDIATTAGATADIAAALSTLPGTQKVGESGRLFVRGGDGHETRTFIDGLLVLAPYTSSAPGTPSRGRFLPFMFKGTSFSTGGYSAEYGQALSSVLALDSKDKAEITRTDIGILSVGGDAGHTHVWERGSLAGKIQYTHLGPYFRLISQRIDWRTPPEALEGHAAFRQESGRHGLFKFYTNFNHADFSLYRRPVDRRDERERYDLVNLYAYSNASYRNSLNERWMVHGGVSWTNVRERTLSGITNLDHRENGFHAKAVLEGSLSDKLELKTGAEIIDREFSVLSDSRRRRIRERVTSTFAEAELHADRYFVARGGVRVEHNGLNNAISADPRFSFAARTGSAGQVSFAYGVFRQSPTNEQLQTNQRLGSEKARHYILNYQRIDDNRTFRIETYYKQYRRLVKNTVPATGDLGNGGYGYANGIELFWRDNRSVKHADYWISYSFLNTKRNYLDFPVEATPVFASKHNLSVVYKHFIGFLKSQVGITWSYASGRPYHDPRGLTFNGATTPPYADLSANWSYLPTPSVIIYLSCTNLPGRENIFGYEFSREPDSLGAYNANTIRQPAKRFVFIGVFITLSKEKSVNQLPNL